MPHLGAEQDPETGSHQRPVSYEVISHGQICLSAQRSGMDYCWPCDLPSQQMTGGLRHSPSLRVAAYLQLFFLSRYFHFYPLESPMQPARSRAPRRQRVSRDDDPDLPIRRRHRRIGRRWCRVAGRVRVPIADDSLPAPTLDLHRRNQRGRIDLEPPRRIVRDIGRHARPIDPIGAEQQPASLQRRGLRRCPLDYIHNTA